MPKPRSKIQETADLTSSPPPTLSSTQTLCRVIKATGNNLFSVHTPTNKTLLVELPAQFRNLIWLKRGSYVLVDSEALADRENKLDGEIVNVVREEREWRKMGYWPKEFGKRGAYDDDSEDEEESRVGKMPSDDEDEEDD
jgi:probable RNA-binding protein EIF1AD